MADPPLKVAFLWHMHQPYYRNPRTGVYRLPWVRLHTVKDYYDMVARLEAFPRIKGNFNLVPCLVEQIREYADGDVQEIHLNLSRKHVTDLTEDEKVSLIRRLFLGNRRTMIEPYPRYRSLLEKCLELDCEYKVEAAIKKLSRQDLLDLQVWSNLAWSGPTLSRDPVVADLRARQRHFTETMKSNLLGKHMEVIQKVLGKYRELAEQGRIEISLSPYFHPILPLLCDADSAKAATPGIRLPESRIAFPEDARLQIVSGLNLHRDVFGRAPAGMWPPEGAVSEASVQLACECGIRWVATDEAILEASLGEALRDRVTRAVKRPDLLYRPYTFACQGANVVVFFRDRVLSDLISFEYATWPAEEAAADFIGRLETIKRDLGKDVTGSIVLVALDGENCWEFYDRGGDTFLECLYSALSENTSIETALLSEFVDGGPRARPLKAIHPGSWINGSFTMWIGHPEDNEAWDMLAGARAQLDGAQGGLPDEKRKAAWRSIHVAEGSDWFWWYGEDRARTGDREFDNLFRAHIRYVYECIGIHAPHNVLEPITTPTGGRPIAEEPAAVIKPVLDGKVTKFYEWKLAGLYQSYMDSAPVIFGVDIIDAIYFGFDHENLYLRLDTSISPQAAEFSNLTFSLEFEVPIHKVLTFRAPQARSPGNTSLALDHESDWPGVSAVALEIIEIAVPFRQIEASPGDVVSLRIAVAREGRPLERRPIHEVLCINVPRPDFDADHWSTL